MLRREMNQVLYKVKRVHFLLTEFEKKEIDTDFVFLYSMNMFLSALRLLLHLYSVITTLLFLDLCTF